MLWLSINFNLWDVLNCDLVCLFYVLEDALIHRDLFNENQDYFADLILFRLESFYRIGDNAISDFKFHLGTTKKLTVRTHVIGD